MDCIRLNNMIFYSYLGAFAVEQELGQRLEVDVELRVSLSGPAATDDLADAIDYSSVYSLIREIVEERRFTLIETVAETIAVSVLAAHDAQEVLVRVRKPNPPVGGLVHSAEVEITRGRRDLVVS